MKTRAAIKWYLLGTGCLLAGLLNIGCEAGDDSTSSLSISPSAVFLSADKVNVVTFTASGGDGTYSWTVSNTNLGEIYVADETAIYKSSTNAGVNVVSVYDGNADVASVEVTQE